ncbi:hypothetical protein [Streptomyces sp. NPDC047453]|uniref:hypothetical protein n=1 Tax=Streptomyces sp. NPDC047453 TaxID=3154812 RepID=UPI003409E991
MSYSIFLLRFVDGEVVTLNAEQFRQKTEPYVVAGGLEEQLSFLKGRMSSRGSVRPAVDGPGQG